MIHKVKKTTAAITTANTGQMMLWDYHFQFSDSVIFSLFYLIFAIFSVN